tara:strand:+ start:782 stop:1756 length:975 start_codon:yes stop_codon:yes gene_type:complete
MAQDNAIEQATAILNGSLAAPVDEVVEDEPVEDIGAEAVITEGEEPEETVEEEGESDDEGPMTLKQLAEAIEVDVDYLYDIEIGMGDNQDPIPVGKLKDEYQAAIRTNTQLQEQLTSQAAEFEQKSSGMQSQQQASEQVQMANYELQDVQKEFNAIDWQRFETESPGEAALARQKFMERHQRAQQTMQQLAQQEEMQEGQHMQAMGEKLVELIPTWSDPAVRTEEQGQIRELLMGMGYTDAMLRNTRDPLAISVVHRLIKAEAQLAGGAAEVKRVRNAPKVLRQANGRFKQKGDQQVVETKKAVSANRNRHTELAAAKAIFNKR